MRIITSTRLRTYWTEYRQAKSSLEHWLVLARAAKWFHVPDVRRTFPGAGLVTVSSGRTVVIFNIGGNKYRLVTVIHYNTRKVFVLRFLTQAEYDSQRWKEDL
ncbi:MAG: type II toxin-antitoxin system HigB family toxin [Nitrospira defluvii]|nr:type II toxin-antitoxin system HigB family toxin [Nitrospira defluvii]